MADVNVDFIFENEQPINADFQLEPDVTYTADIKLSEATRDHTKLYNRERANQHPMGAITGLEEALSELNVADEQLEQAIADEATARQNADITLQENITAENNRAVEVESQIINNLSTEVNRLDVEDARLNQKIDAERQRAENIEAEISANLVTEKTAREQGDSILSNAITEEQRRAEQAESELSDKIDTVEDDLTEDIDALATIVDNNYNTLDTRITNVADELGQQIEENVVALQQEDTALQNQINAHSQTLTSHDTRITNNANAIIQEATDRQSADDVLQDQIDTLSARGRFLSLWDATTGLAESTPQISPYIYKTGDYFIVDKVGEVNYRPTGTEYVIGQASTVVETEELATDDVYYFDGATWHLQINHGKTVSFANLAGSPDDNIALKTALDNKQPVGDYATNTALTQGLATKANDSNVVHKTGNETVAGNKTLTGLLTVQNELVVNTQTSDGTYLKIRDTGTDGQIAFINTKASDGSWKGAMYFDYDSGTDKSTCSLKAFNYVTAPKASGTNATNDSNVATCGWVNDTTTSTNVVHRSGNETVGGVKEFTGTIKLNSITSTTFGNIAQLGSGKVNFYTQDSNGWTNNYVELEPNGTTTVRANSYVQLMGQQPASTNQHPTATTSTTDYHLATTGWVNSKGYATTEMLNSKQDVIEDLADIRDNATTGAGLAPQVEVNTQRIEDLTVAKFPNVVIVGTPHIEGGQVSNYSDTNYLQFPFVDISRGQPFDIYFSFTTNQDITTQQNILDAYFGIALAIQNGKGVMALSSNGTSWDIGTTTGTNILLPNTTYYVKYSWTGTQYNASLSTDDQEYVPDMIINSTLSPYKATIFIGGSPNIFGAGSAHPFKGTINFNKSKVVVNGITVWEGMADVGLASRANVSLNNLDEVGEARFNAKQDKLIAGDNITIENNVISSAGGAVDNKSITKNTDNQIQAVGVIEKNTGAVKYDWIGTLAEYNAQNVETLHPDWVCFITDDVSGGTSVYTKTEVDNAISTALTAMLDSAFPVGYRYITEASTCPLATLIPNSTWVLTSQGRVIQGADSNHASGTTAEAGLPNITGSITLEPNIGVNATETNVIVSEPSGAFGIEYETGVQVQIGSTTASFNHEKRITINASRSNSIYGNSTTVQPPAEFVNIYKRIA